MWWFIIFFPATGFKGIKNSWTTFRSNIPIATDFHQHSFHLYDRPAFPPSGTHFAHGSFHLPRNHPFHGKMLLLIAGYTTLSREKKERYDERALCRFTGKLMFFLAFCMLLSIISTILESPVLLSVAVFLFVAAITFAIIYANTCLLYTSPSPRD